MCDGSVHFVSTNINGNTYIELAYRPNAKPVSLP